MHNNSLINLAVGKTNILSRYTHGKFYPDYDVTLGTEFMAKSISINDKNIRLQIWDTAGEEAFRSITRSYYKSSACAFIVYDITNMKSFDNIKIWLNDVHDLCNKNTLIYLIGNKSDLDNERQVSKEEGQKFANENNLKFYETSALNGDNIEDIFIQSATDLVNKLDSGEILDIKNSGIKIFDNIDNNNINEDKSQNKCC